jgi:hypothetical protein
LVALKRRYFGEHVGPIHAVDYEPFIKSQLALRQLTLRIFWYSLVT